MARSRVFQQEKPLAKDTVTIAAALRGNEPPTPPAALEPHSEQGLSTFWRIFGGTLLSIAALVTITLYNQFVQNLNDLRREVNLHHEARGDFIKKDEFNSRLSSIWGSLKDIQTSQAGLQASSERAKILDEQLQRQIRLGEEERKDMQQRVEEQRKTGAEERKEHARKVDELRRQVEDERRDLLQKLEVQRKVLEDERREWTRKLEESNKVNEDQRKELMSRLNQLAERMATVEGRQTAKTTAGGN